MSATGRLYESIHADPLQLISSVPDGSTSEHTAKAEVKPASSLFGGKRQSITEVHISPAEREALFKKAAAPLQYSKSITS